MLTLISFMECEKLNVNQCKDCKLCWNADQLGKAYDMIYSSDFKEGIETVLNALEKINNS